MARAFLPADRVGNLPIYLTPTTGGQNKFTISLWFWHPSSVGAGAYVNLFSQGGGSGSDYFIGIGGAGGADKLTYYFKASGVFVDPGSHTLSLSTWYNIITTYDSTAAAPGLRTFLNAASDGTSAQAGSVISWQTGTAPQIGPGVNVGGTTGRIADVAMWNVVLSSVEITALANGRRPYRIRPLNLIGTGSGQGLWMPLDGLQSPEPDLSLNGNTSGFIGSPTLAFGPPIDPITPRWQQWQDFFIPSFTLMPQIVT